MRIVRPQKLEKSRNATFGLKIFRTHHKILRKSKNEKLVVRFGFSRNSMSRTLHILNLVWRTPERLYAPRIDLSVCRLQVNEAMSAWRIRFAPPGFKIDMVMARIPAR